MIDKIVFHHDGDRTKTLKIEDMTDKEIEFAVKTMINRIKKIKEFEKQGFDN